MLIKSALLLCLFIAVMFFKQNCFIFFWISNSMEKRQIRMNFLFQFKLDRKSAETALNINDALGPGTAIERTTQWWFKKFCSAAVTRALKMKSASGRPFNGREAGERQ